MRVAVSLLVLSAFALALPAQDRETTADDLLRAVERKLVAANERAGPCIACVVVSRSEKYPKPTSDVPGALGTFDPKQFAKDNPNGGEQLAKALDLSDPRAVADHGFACGVVIDDKGLVLTPYHVVDGATKIYVHLPGAAGSYADIHAADACHDLAVLRLLSPPAGLKAIKFADVRLTQRDGPRGNVTSGKLAVLVASAYVPNLPINKPSAALGSVTNVRHHLPIQGLDQRQRRLDDYYLHGPFLEHDAKLNTGISGAALLNLDGEMIGLTTSAPVPGLGEKQPEYAFPLTDQRLRVIEVLRRGEEVEIGFLGVLLGTNFASLTVSGTTPLGPAAKAGISPGDVITHIDGATVRNYDDLLGHIGSALAGTKVTLTIGNTRDVTLALGKWQHTRPVIASVRPDPVFGLRVDHDSILAQTVGERARATTPKNIPVGVSIGTLAPNSPAEAAFKKLGDDPQKRWLVTHVNGKAVTTPAEFYAAAKGQKTIKLTVIDPTEAKRQEREVSFP
ncbi:pdz dhr glgf domain-containing protein : Trypsin-like serine protease with C-terminal PDZ domain OS=Singulisphaera acidiphila (strain ATCC BAA-1392 / DSM 18658 / VKM B-2454 / MOB10) GN=Sinac_5148 PE=4 SV=1: Trypsin_2: PDZ_2 [Gemmata massiliana]|uniref:PDZ domain-containing protein n=1 Tax=Gemmata massiliana TaxID=1210884 RepID=A0A6P2D6M3_9BACT|nr:trypsin-like peptidase domain-containing protein [Gemmata massiliana]VTR95784.1 pdz dhr glgf domain-containing protein : Trypsin-like serine protease with C-terminal PDZ domain OS=Singulisphaera acidiphila (strain ATCC BAA-1392 / DSM 18658 / VKM B-2454 / MOB10) GN=Sinac_5148 PE=4 SV=1: Trypsin_2: PDZ_2 [Gemmata massiliana]